MTDHESAIAQLKPSELVKACGMTRHYAFELIKADKDPSLKVAALIERQFGIPASAWAGRRDRKRSAGEVA